MSSNMLETVEAKHYPSNSVQLECINFIYFCWNMHPAGAAVNGNFV